MSQTVHAFDYNKEFTLLLRMHPFACYNYNLYLRALISLTTLFFYCSCDNDNASNLETI